jgi:hypothetical protein
MAGEHAIVDPPDDEAAYAQLLAAATDDEERAAAWVGLSSTAYRPGDMSGVIDTCRMALDTIGPGPGRARLLGELGWAEVRAGRPRRGRPHLEHAAEMLRGWVMGESSGRCRSGHRRPSTGGVGPRRGREGFGKHF